MSEDMAQLDTDGGGWRGGILGQGHRGHTGSGSTHGMDYGGGPRHSD